MGREEGGNDICPWCFVLKRIGEVFVSVSVFYILSGSLIVIVRRLAVLFILCGLGFQ